MIDPTAPPSTEESAFNAAAAQGGDPAPAPAAAAPSPHPTPAPAPAPSPSPAPAPAAPDQSIVKKLEETQLPPGMLDALCVKAIDQVMLARCGSYAAKRGVILNNDDEDQLRLSEKEKKDILEQLPLVTPLLEQYAKYFKYFGIALLALSLWRMSNVRIARVAQGIEAQKKAKKRTGSRDDDPDADDDDYPE